jgi:hypothetical protein
MVTTQGPHMISPVELALLALASHRGTQLVVHDSILDPLRMRIDSWQQRPPRPPATPG